MRKKMWTILGLSLVLLPTMITSGEAASHRPAKFLVSAIQLNKVENPSELTRWVNVIDSKEGRAIIVAVASYFGYAKLGTAIAEGIHAVNSNYRNKDEQHWGYIQAPVNYTSCQAYVIDPSVNCNGTFTGVLTTADKSPDHIDGLHWYAVVPKPVPGAGRCWINGTVVTTFVRASIPRPKKCGSVNDNSKPAFHYGK